MQHQEATTHDIHSFQLTTILKDTIPTENLAIFFRTRFSNKRVNHQAVLQGFAFTNGSFCRTKKGSGEPLK